MTKEERDVIELALKMNAKYEVQYVDYPENTWTAPALFTRNRCERALSDTSVKNIRLIFKINNE